MAVTLTLQNNGVVLDRVEKSLARNLEAKYSWYNCTNLNDNQQFVKHRGNGVCDAYPGMLHVLHKLFTSNGVDAKIDFIIPFPYEAISQVRKVNSKVIWNPKLIPIPKIGNGNRSNDIVG